MYNRHDPHLSFDLWVDIVRVRNLNWDYECIGLSWIYNENGPMFIYCGRVLHVDSEKCIRENDRATQLNTFNVHHMNIMNIKDKNLQDCIQIFQYLSDHKMIFSLVTLWATIIVHSELKNVVLNMWWQFGSHAAKAQNRRVAGILKTSMIEF